MFNSTTYGKWILTGEHAVLRGGSALVFPLLSRSMTFRYRQSTEKFIIHSDGLFGTSCVEVLSLLLKEVEKHLHFDALSTKGELSVYSDLPLARGLGTSASLCVNLSRWLNYLGLIELDQIFDFSRKLEDRFHGESSGVDIAIAMTSQGILFEPKKSWLPFTPKWKPLWYLSYTGQSGVTSHCVHQVKEYFENDPSQAQKIDAQMKQSVLLAQEALSNDRSVGLPLLIRAIESAATCFKEWDLITTKMSSQIQWLKSSGATAVKPTGSGGGGYLLSLWTEKPPAQVLPELISVHA